MSLHLPVSVDDAMIMLDSRIPLTYAERKMIVEGLFELGCKTGIEAEKNRLRKIAEELRGESPVTNTMATLLDSWVDADGTRWAREYTDPTTQIRENLTRKAAERTKIDGRHLN